MPRLDMLEHNTNVAKNLSRLSDDHRNRLRLQFAPHRDGLERRLVGHLDGPTAAPHLFSVGFVLGQPPRFKGHLVDNRREMVGGRGGT